MRVERRKPRPRRKRKAQRKQKAISYTRIVWSLDRRIVLIDQGPLRKEAEREAKAGMRDMARFSVQLDEFERRILPEFQRWESATFGALLTEERELHARLGQLKSLINDVSMESYFRGCHPHEAYAMIMRARERAADSPEMDDPDEDDTDPMPDNGDGFTAEERIFHSFLRNILGVEPEFLHRAEYENLFREFKRETGQNSGWGPHGARGGHSGYNFPAPKPHRIGRIKELYRVLARRLHPDSPASAPATAGLWHDLQDAYARGDIERMEILLAITDLHEGADGSRTTLFHMREVAREFARAIEALKSRLAKARRTPAWKFWKQPDRTLMEKLIRRDLDGKLASLREEVANHEAVIERWKRAADNRKRPQPRKKAPRKSPPHSSGQSFFDF